MSERAFETIIHLNSDVVFRQVLKLSCLFFGDVWRETKRRPAFQGVQTLLFGKLPSFKANVVTQAAPRRGKTFPDFSPWLGCGVPLDPGDVLVLLLLCAALGPAVCWLVLAVYWLSVA